METSITGIGAAAVSPERQAEAEKKRLRESCQEFESVMVSYMMKSMRDSVIKAEEPENAREMYEEMLVGQVSKQISKTPALGVGDMLCSSLETQVKARPAAGSSDKSLASQATERLPEVLSESGVQQLGFKAKGFLADK
ncbi:MAG: rod-binding protein [Desulfobacteraceae bacterium]|nr:rod-binding protein [Desulfobacteraceae bacterium]